VPRSHSRPEAKHCQTRKGLGRNFRGPKDICTFTFLCETRQETPQI
jgi:hypothetical protein